MSGTPRTAISIGAAVDIVLKKDQRTGTLTEGVVKNTLTRASSQSHGIKVRMEDGQVGRVKNVL